MEVNLQQIKAAAKAQFGQLPGVLGVGLGERSLRIYVRSAEICQQLPDEFQNIPVDCIVTGDISAMS
jgi:hypothetical protein